ncbi:MAG TPA: LCP family protein [Actinomycetota bacterium]|nr:LCP family protein [Actinomycetota bacterium]
MRRRDDQEHDEHEELFGEYPALLTASDLEAPAAEPEAGVAEPRGDEAANGKRRRFWFGRRRKHASGERPATEEAPQQASTLEAELAPAETASEQVAELPDVEAQELRQPRRKRRRHQRTRRTGAVEEPQPKLPPVEEPPAEPIEAPEAIADDPARKPAAEEVVIESGAPPSEAPTPRRRHRRRQQERIGHRIRAALEAAQAQAEAPPGAEPEQLVVEEPEIHEPPVALEAEEPPPRTKGRLRAWWSSLWVVPQQQPDGPPEDLYLAQLASAELLPSESPPDSLEEQTAVEEPRVEEPPVETTVEEPVEDLDELERFEEFEEVVEEPEPKPARPRRRKPLRPRRTYMRSRVRIVRWLGLILVAAAVGSVLPQVWPRAGDQETEEGTAAAPAVPDQQVVAWIVQGEEGETFLTLLASGERRPFALAIPSNLTVTVPGQSLGTLEEAAATGDHALVQVALQNVLGVPVDASITTDLGTFAGIVDVIGGIEVADQVMSGEAVLAYLHPAQSIPLPDEPFLRWQDVLEGLMDAIAARPETAANLPSEIQGAMTAALPEPPDLVALPVIDFGAGVIRVDRDALKELVNRRFVVTNPADAIRLVVLNGVGTPGIGEEVARILVPEGFLLVSSQNANTFDLKETRIIASSEADVPAAERARELLGMGRVYLGSQPGLADVTVVVGRDFGGS